MIQKTIQKDNYFYFLQLLNPHLQPESILETIKKIKENF